MALIFILTLFLISLPHSNALEWDDFTNNLATDLAPLIALFGEQVTKQFLSESLSIWDNIIFAMAPLGILTAVVSAIRVCGDASLRAFIGRAQESPGTAEVELLSSTSDTTAELWHEGGIARVFGSPQILEVVKLETKNDDYKGENCTAGIFLFSDACGDKGPWKTKRSDLNDQIQREEDQKSTVYSPPNLSLNIGIKRQSKKLTYGAAAFGIFLQTGVLIFAALTVYRYPSKFLNGEKPVDEYAFPMMVSGTVLLCLGMFLCAFIIERSTQEVHYKQEVSKDGKPASEIYWVQPGGQKIGDQVFRAFVGHSNDHRYIKSTRSQDDRWYNQLLWVTVAATMLGFVIQFVGLRGLHSSVILAQLVATLLMAIVRAGLRTQRMDADRDLLVCNYGPEAKDYRRGLEGHELDYLALHLYGKIAIGMCPQQESTLITEAPEIPSKVGFVVKALKTRARLARLTTEDTFGLSWKGLQVREVTSQLRSAIEGSMDMLSARLKDVNAQQHYWPINLQSRGSAENLFLRLHKEGLAWRIGDSELEALVGLFGYECITNKQNKRTKHKASIRLIATSIWPDNYLEEARTYYRIWIQRRLEPKQDRILYKPWYSTPRGYYIINDNQVFGCQGSPKLKSLEEGREQGQALYVNTANSYLRMCAQDVYMSFLGAALRNIDTTGGKTEARTASDRQNILLLRNSFIEELADHFDNSGLGSREDAYMCIVPLLVRESKLPGMDDVLHVVRDQVEAYKNDGKWKEAEGLLQWVCYNSGVTKQEKAFEVLGDFYHMAMRDASDAIQAIGFMGVCGTIKKISLLSAIDPNALKVIRQYGWIGLRIAEEIGHPNYQDELQDLKNEVLGYAGNIMLCEWAQKDNMTVAKYLLGRKDLDVNQAGLDGRTSLSWATQNGNFELVKLLLQKGANRNLSDNDQKTPLAYAAESGNHEILTILLDGDSSSINQNIRSNGKTPLMLASERGYEMIVRKLLQTSGISIDSRDSSESSAFMLAVQSGQNSVAQILLKNGAYATSKNNSGDTALHLAAATENLEIAKVLINLIVDIDARDNEGKTAFHRTISSKRVDIAKLLAENGADINLLFQDHGSEVTMFQVAISNENLEMVRLLAELDAFIDLEDKICMSAFHRAAVTSNPEIIKVLLEKGADRSLGSENCYYNIGLYQAILEEDLSALSFVLENRPKRSEENIHHEMASLLCMAVRTGNLKLVELFTNKAPDVDLNMAARRGPVLEFALIVAAEIGNSALANFLIKKGCDPDLSIDSFMSQTRLADIFSFFGEMQLPYIDENLWMVRLLIKSEYVYRQDSDTGRTLLHFAAEAASFELVRLLVEHRGRVEVNRCDYEAKTPLHYAMEGSYHGDDVDQRLEVVMLLIEKGANVKASDMRGRTIFHAALTWASLETRSRGPRVSSRIYSRIQEYLIERGVDCNAEDPGWRSPDGELHDEGMLPLAHIFDLGDNIYVGFWAAKRMIDNGAELNKRLHGGSTLLHQAVDQTSKAFEAMSHNLYRELIKYMIERGADINARDYEGRTTLHRATWLCQTTAGSERHLWNLELLQYLIKKGADINAKDNEGRTALYRVVEEFKGELDLVKYLIESGAKGNRESKRAWRSWILSVPVTGEIGLELLHRSIVMIITV